MSIYGGDSDGNYQKIHVRDCKTGSGGIMYLVFMKLHDNVTKSFGRLTVFADKLRGKYRHIGNLSYIMNCILLTLIIIIK